MNTNEESQCSNPKPFHKINKFYLGGFKAFKNTQEIPIRPITLVFGPNSSGKSSLLQGLVYALEGESTRSIDIGKFEDFTNAHSVVPKIGFSFNQKNLCSFQDQIPLFKKLLDDSLSWGLSANDENSAAQLQIKMDYEFEKRTDAYERDPKNYSVNRDSYYINYDCGTGYSLTILDLDLPYFRKSEALISDTKNFDDPYDHGLPLQFVMDDQKILIIESKYKDFLLKKISDSYRNLGMSSDDIAFHLACIEEEISNLLAEYNATDGRIYIDKMAINTAWDIRCRKYFSSHISTDRTEGVSRHIEARSAEFWSWKKNQISEFNSRNYNDKKNIQMKNGYKSFYTDDFIHMIADDIRSSKRRTKKSLETISDQGDYMFGTNVFVKFKIVYSAVFAILSDINLRYISAFSSVGHDHRPKITYIPAQRSFLDDQGLITGAWSGLINDNENRDQINYWLNQLTKYYRISEPRKLYSESQVSEILSGAYKLGDPHLDTTIDSTLRIEDTRVPDKKFRPQDVGFGIQKLLPVIAASVYKPSEVFAGFFYRGKESLDIIAIEEPEMHLHPKLQSDLGDLFVENVINNSEKTFLIETHSEHLLLRILKRIRDRDLSSDAVSVLYVHPGNGNSGAYVEHLELDEDGEFLKPWPPGFFDVRRKNII